MALIVIVDDRVTNRNIFSRLAASIGKDIEVKAFGDPVEALEWLKSHAPDLIITDYKMPEMNGADFIRAYRQLPDAAETPVVVITVYEERSFRLRALEAGATDFLNSPVDHHEFVTRSRNLLALRRHQIALSERAAHLARELADSERSRERAIRDSIDRLAQVIDTLPVLISAADASGRTIFVNAFATEFFGVDPASVVGAPQAALFGDAVARKNAQLDAIVFQTGAPQPSIEETLCDRKGQQRHFLTTKTPLRDHEGLLHGVLTSSLDITANKETEQRLRVLAHSDSLTGLPNRAKLLECVQEAMAATDAGGRPFALHLIDLDSFKSVNDVFGHSAGDGFLKQIAAQLQLVMRDSDVLARLGGDEFAILQPGVKDRAHAADFAMRVSRIVSSFTDADVGAMRASASIGVALYPGDGVDAEDLLRNADLAMYRAKQEGGNAFHFFATDLKARAQNAVRLDTDLRLALERHEFVLYYQPQFCFRTGRIIGAEALLRWRHPERGLVPPGLFLPHAEETGLIVDINDWVVMEACRQAALWQSETAPDFRVAINMSAWQFRKQNVPLNMLRVIAQTGVDPRSIELELTESVVMRDIDAVARDLLEIAKLGVEIAIDDFGTGYSSLAYVKKLPVHRLKIDQTFVRSMAETADDAAIVRAIVSLGHTLGLKVVAEGVETQGHFDLLSSYGCDVAQGFLLGKPCPAEMLEKLLKTSAEKLSA
jgi:diguanylate cyclase (GGDEF)-like protein/PAS domain S-box-containing protein